MIGRRVFMNALLGRKSHETGSFRSLWHSSHSVDQNPERTLPCLDTSYDTLHEIA
jgi:hypothetical protein